MTVRLEDLQPCFQGIIPSILTTCSRDGEPNVTYLSQVHYVDLRRVALSCQFFNKTSRNVRENPHASVHVVHPVTFESYRLLLRFHHEETAGPLFDKMALRIQAIASHTGMAGVFKLRSADLYEVLGVERVEGFLAAADGAAPAPPLTLPAGPMTELRGLQVVSDRIARAADLEALLANTLAALDEVFGFAHAMVLVPEEPAGHLVALASRGYGEQGIGAEVKPGDGLIGTVAARRRMVRVSGVRSEMRYGRAIRERIEESGAGAGLCAEIPLPGLPDAQAQLALPLLAGDRLVGVLALESRDPLCFDDWDEAYMQIVANQIAMGIDRMSARADDEGDVPPAPAAGREPDRGAARRRTFRYYRNDDCVFVDGEYLVRNVPGKILWKLLGLHAREGRTEFANRELRLDPSLGLPPVKDNLESRLILLRRRLAEKCPEVRLVPVRRGRFALELGCRVELVETDSG
jgi:putative methionine-R-sulfoxide reductase with GAF domain